MEVLLAACAEQGWQTVRHCAFVLQGWFWLSDGVCVHAADFSSNAPSQSTEQVEEVRRTQADFLFRQNDLEGAARSYAATRVPFEEVRTFCRNYISFCQFQFGVGAGGVEVRERRRKTGAEVIHWASSGGIQTRGMFLVVFLFVHLRISYTFVQDKLQRTVLCTWLTEMLLEEVVRCNNLPATGTARLDSDAAEQAVREFHEFLSKQAVGACLRCWRVSFDHR